jgi:RNA polymerase sigma factor (sigma-70 family)
VKVDDDSMRRGMVRALEGDRAAYRFVLEESRRWLHGFYRRRVPPQMIDDLIQETLISVHSRRQSFDTSRPYLPWLAAIARYRWVDALRKMRDEDELHPEEIASDEDDSEVVARLSISRLLSHLPAGQANAIVLTRIEGRSVAEAASICGQSESLVKVNVHRGLRRLAALVESE